MRRVVRGRLDTAVERLRDAELDEGEAVHEARKDIKKLRSALRLVRPGLGDQVYRRENKRYRDAARRLSGARDAQALAETVAALEDRFEDESPPGGWKPVAEALTRSEPADAAEADRLRDRVASEIEAGRRELETLSPSGKGFEVVRPGLRRAYSRGRRRFAEAAGDPTDERLHEWRKRSKDLWYHLRLLRPAWRPVLEPVADQAHELSDRLGDDHDLVVLTERLNDPGIALTAPQREHLDDLIRRRRGELQTEAFGLGERLYAEKPKHFANRIRAYWQAPRV